MDAHRPMSGSAYFLGDRQIELGASMQKHMGLFTSVAEATVMYYAAVSQAEVGLLFFRDILKEISCKQDLAIFMSCNDNRAVDATHNPMTGKMRHINIEIHQNTIIAAGFTLFFTARFAYGKKPYANH